MEIRKIFKAEMAHRVADAYSTRCRGVHGHSYIFEVGLVGGLDCVGMIMDFKELKDKLGSFLDSFDHALLIQDTDQFLVENADKLNSRWVVVPYNPTAENMAIHIFTQAKEIGLPVSYVIVHETATGFAKAIHTDTKIEWLSKVKYSEETAWNTK